MPGTGVGSAVGVIVGKEIQYNAPGLENCKGAQTAQEVAPDVDEYVFERQGVATLEPTELEYVPAGTIVHTLAP